MSNYAEFSSTTINDSKSTDKIGPSTWAFQREIELTGPDKNIPPHILGDRDMFNKFSNTNESIDVSSFNLTDSYGMPIQGGSTVNNKKSLLSTPYVMESNNTQGWTPTSTTWNPNDMYADFTSQPTQQAQPNSSTDSALEQAYSNNLAGVSQDNGLCKIESDCLGFEYELTKQKIAQKSRDIVVDISSPFALGYVWKTLILLSKNPSTDKLVKMLGIKSKDSIVSDMKRHGDVFEDSGKLQIEIPLNSAQTSNTNLIQKIESIYKISIIHSSDPESYDNKVTLNLDWNFLLEIPFYYQPKITTDYLVGYNKTKTKFIELIDVPVFLLVDKTSNIVCLEIPCASNMVLGFIYTPTRELVQTIPYELITQPKKPEVLVKKLIIPKINRNKKTLYSKNFKEVLTQIHLGEIVYGTLYQTNIMANLGLGIGVSQQVEKNQYQIDKTFDDITINHKCFYYVKNNFIQNKILVTGTICY
jgi:hypothetical protein